MPSIGNNLKPGNSVEKTTQEVRPCVERADSFFSALFAAAPRDTFTHLWTLPDKLSHWTSLAAGSSVIAETAIQLAGSGDVYVAVSVADVPGPPNRRISALSSGGIMGLWADIDIAEPNAHKKVNLPPDEAGALSVLDAVGVAPSIVVHSGHGLQAWWLFKEFWRFDSEADRLAAAELARRWNTLLRLRAAERGWTIDSTFDLARVMRVPGTLNRKTSPLAPVVIRSISDQRYVSADLARNCLDDDAHAEASMATAGSKLETLDSSPLLQGMRPSSAPPKLEWDLACAVSDELPLAAARLLGLPSPSEHDLSIASRLAYGDWSDQMIFDVLYFNRMARGENLKSSQYYARTIRTARRGQS